ncbi:MAG TPA: hypothetical protein DIU28_16170 [Anabaena sp. UBA12330]|jgi:hypothetical protein|nr:hypothetical protein [Aphanizomenon flos-aquae UKL13-PB]MBO1062173.1 hypothetical protein [Aphanizomenon flos-aquae CP01]HCQ22902.1 hypothetical protein [Anabaena sp. UBA12330]
MIMSFICRLSLILPVTFYLLPVVCNLGVNENNTFANAQNIEQLRLNQNTLPKSISQAVLRDASRVSGVKSSNLQITQVTSTNFSNSCIFKFGEVCTREYNPIPGWIVIIQVKEQSWVYHVNKSGSQILLDPKITNNQLPKKISNAVLSDASKRSGLAISSLKVTQSIQKNFSNSCTFNFGEVCTQIFDPIKGWEVIVKVKNQFWTYHVDITGTRIVLDPQITKI